MAYLTLYLLPPMVEVDPDGMRRLAGQIRKVSPDVARQFAHLHDVRIYQLQNRAKDLATGLEKFQSKGAPTVSPGKAELRDALTASGDAIESFLADVLEGVPKRRGFKKGIFTTLSYLVAHESHHRGNILLTLKQSGHPVEKSAAYAMWDWDRM